jgi:hypothetical protein
MRNGHRSNDYHHHFSILLEEKKPHPSTLNRDESNQVHNVLVTYPTPFHKA